MTEANNILKALYMQGNQEKATHSGKFFKTGKGEYGEGDRFIGVTVPQQQAIAKAHRTASLDTLSELIGSPFHEVRLTALLILVDRYQKTKKKEEKKEYVNFYISNIRYVNNWDLVDLSCYKLLGEWLIDKDRDLLYDWATSGHLWKQRVAIITCMCFIHKGDFKDCLAISDILLHHPHDLIHKAVGWSLRVIGKYDKQALTGFLASRYQTMPRTMLRYAIEHFPGKERKRYLNGEVGKEQ